MPKRILWLSQHEPLLVQVERLALRYGSDVQILRDVNSFTTAEEVIRRFNAGGYDDWVVVAPLSVIGRLCEICEATETIKPLMANMVQLRVADKAKADLTYNRRYYKFAGFRRVYRLVLEFGEQF